jgi:hypothetical protein
MLNGIKKEERITRTLDGLCSDTSNQEVLRALAEQRLRQLPEKEIMGWWELKEDTGE